MCFAARPAYGSVSLHHPMDLNQICVLTLPGDTTFLTHKTQLCIHINSNIPALNLPLCKSNLLELERAQSWPCTPADWATHIDKVVYTACIYTATCLPVQPHSCCTTDSDLSC